ncbi:hypothetical protein Athai_29950 [Actinocatenispora thailandica]|uniref:Uncharacterized protein n=1 Tax=Actinocatenispora thailandica TaxID=227318 RepID=A0A7R7DQ66_9ACTN|nr:hypothetical protein [Actinocatenispora thailandica]BCJ35492.1 hypothetical protein Athai_29950 [Actinocatenispora thailandica]
MNNRRSGPDTPVVLRDTHRPGPASVLVEANDRLQDLRELLAGALTGDEPTRAKERTGG